nr:hypothetical protein [Streptomyces chartreusis]
MSSEPGFSDPSDRAGAATFRRRRRVRTHDPTREWNLARRPHRRLLGDRTDALGVTLVDRGDVETYRVLPAWGWSCLSAEYGKASRFAPRRLLVLR